MLRTVRRTIAIVLWLLSTLSLLGIFRVAWVGRIQLVPALLAINVGILVLLAIVTLVFGRVYCSVICPMGILQDLVGWLSRRVRPAANRYSHPLWGHLTRPLILIIGIWGFVEGIHWLPALLDPWSEYGRMVTQGLYPLWLWVKDLLSGLNGPLGTWFEHEDFHTASFQASVIAAVVALFVFLTAWIWGRTFCNSLCPVGWTLSWLSRCSLFTISFDASRCDYCGRCEARCKASCLDARKLHIDPSRCVSCFDCIPACDKGAIHYRFRYTRPALSGKGQAHDESRRQFLATSALFLQLPFVSRAQDIIEEGWIDEGTYYRTEQLDAEHEKRVKVYNRKGQLVVERYKPVMPPSTGNIARYLSRCTSCHLCIVHCPTHILRPSTTEYGPEGLLVPTVNFTTGFCRPECNACADVCPTGAIQNFSLSRKQRDKMGVAVFNSLTCVTATDDVDCDACVRHCPHQAITMVVRGNHKVPKVSVNRCTGCGACEFYCPALPKAIHIEGLLS